MKARDVAFIFSALLIPAAALAGGSAVHSPEAPARSYAQNYKDMVLATCLAQAYKADPAAARDAGSSVSELRDWTYYDMEKAPDEIKALVDAYLKRDYFNPLAEAEVKGVRFDTLKCLDLYHSKALEEQVSRLVINPAHSYRQDNPPQN